MTDSIDYAISKADASELRGATGLPGELRLMAIRRLHGMRGTEAILELFAQYMGLANSVIANNREAVELFAITECDVHPHAVHKINLPTIFGALNGVMNAVDPTASMCEGCAFRLGTPANQSPSTSVDAMDCVTEAFTVGDFKCHMKPNAEGEMNTLCAGYRKAKKERRVHA